MSKKGKICKGCKIDKEREEFSRHPATKEGLQPYCKECSNEIRRKKSEEYKSRLELNPELIPDIKECSKCGETKGRSNFSKQTSSPDGLNPECKQCQSLYYFTNKERIQEKNKEYYENNKERILERNRSYDLKYKDWRREYNRQWVCNQYRTNPNFRAKDVMRKMLLRCLRSDKDGYTEEYLGYTPNQLRLRIEHQFTDGMSWDNHGEVWEVDHKIPMQYFLDKGEERPHIINALSNLKPLLKTENRQKSDKMIYCGDS